MDSLSAGAANADQAPTLNSQHAALPDDARAAVSGALEDWRIHDKVRRLWERDASLWTGADESRWLGWLDAITDAELLLDPLDRLVAEVRREELSHVLLLGMGGSSLCPEVLSTTFGRQEGFPELHVLDSTVPAQIRSVERRIDPERTLFIVSSKSGTTLEPNILLQYFFDGARRRLGNAVGRRFVAVTDPDSKLESRARELGFRAIFPGVPSIGGRYSALSAFGLVPAALMGLDVRDLLRRARVMALRCGASVAPAENPGVELGSILGCMGLLGRDKVTFIATRSLIGLGAWLEQLLAESTGKQGQGLIPIDGESLGSPEDYERDRMFVSLKLETDGATASIDRGLERLEAGGHPVVRIGLTDRRNLVQEFFRWEIATAVAGSLLKINPFDQPDVEASKIATRRLTEQYEATGSLPEETPFAQDHRFALFTNEPNRTALAAVAGESASPSEFIRAHLGRLERGDYFAVLTYLEMSQSHRGTLQQIRQGVRHRARVATAIEFGPRFLHSTGQAYKGGPATGLFVQMTSPDPEDLPVPAQRFTFGVVKAAQAQGDLDVLLERGRRVLRVHLKGDPADGLAAFAEIVDQWAAEHPKAPR